ncbi:N-acetylmuramoyl-L-alanine amidase [Cellulomonas alba]|uniref:N-acetylmuramoyl-L-alanine amidase n=1 Tax=Cellulomonas alba TaxID=3053467 RepID=A0ABT7SCV8_9CELL|nr:N-acetylmuramoyl-L-alanine amidase [Cellulomonas alba]MDM7854017.1 N-acetylmuramoyl-L-alanine amidase [Cellulomonas alba]
MHLVVRATVVVALAATGLVAPTVSFDAAQAAPRPVAPQLHRLAVHGVDRAAARARGAFAAAASGEVPAAVANRLDPDAAVPLPSDPPATPAPADPADVAALDAPTATAHFVAAGVTWDPGQDVTVSEVALRVREQGRWSAWQSLTQTVEGVPGERPGTEPLLTNGADGVQVRVSTADGAPAPRGLRVDLVDPGSSPADGQAEPSAPAASAQAATGDVLRPRIVTRAQWGADESLGSPWPDVSSRLSAMYLHHTAGSNTYTKAQAAAQVRAIFAFHVKGRGWPDIGYQFLVDRFGTIYQGRRDAIADLPIGAQAGGYNTDTIGVSAIGNFQTAKPSSAMVASIERVFAWEAYAHKLDVRGRTTLITGTSTGSDTRAKAGAKVTVPVLLGHRDTNGTACPGTNLYAKLPTIRVVVAAKVDAAVASYGSPRPPLAAPAAVAPTAAQYPVQWAGSATYAWKPVAGAVRYQVLTSSSALAENGPDLRSWTVYATVAGTSAKVTTDAGRTRAIAVRGLDASGRRGPVTEIAQVSRAVPWSAVTLSSAWAARTDGGVTSYRADAPAALKVKVAQARALVVRVRGDVAGELAVSSGGTALGRLAVPAGGPSEVRTLTLTLPHVVTGTVTVQRSAGTVDVVGLGFPRPRVTDPSLSNALPPARPVAVAIARGEAPVKLGSSLRLRWHAASGATSYEVMARHAAPGTGFTSTWTRVATSTSTSATVRLTTRGYSWAFAVRAVGAGGRSPLARYAITTRPLAGADLTRSAGWTVASVTRAYANKEYRASTAGRTLTADPRGVGVRHVAVVVDAAPGRGRLAVYVAGKRVGTISTAATTHQLHRVAVLDLPSGRAGTVVLRTLDHKPVRVSAVVLAR